MWASPEQPVTWKGYRTSQSDSGRDVMLIAVEEIANAMADIVLIASTAYDDELLRQTAATFGRKSITQQLKERLDAALAWGIEHGRLSFETDSAGNRLFINR